MGTASIVLIDVSVKFCVAYASLWLVRTSYEVCRRVWTSKSSKSESCLETMERWKRENFGASRREGSVSSTWLILVGYPFTGKTEWAKSFGDPDLVSYRFRDSLSVREDATHVVVDDVDIREFRCWREATGVNVSETAICLANERGRKY